MGTIKPILPGNLVKPTIKVHLGRKQDTHLIILPCPASLHSLGAVRRKTQMRKNKEDSELQVFLWQPWKTRDPFLEKRTRPVGKV